MKCNDILQQIEQDFPTYKAYEWDNVGLLAGRDDKEVKRVFVALDATDTVIEEAIQWGADMLITHHPLIFSPVKKVNNQNFITNRLIRLIQNDISYYAMHTNYDIVKMADLASERLGLVDSKPLEVSGWDMEEGLGKIGMIPELQPVTVEQYASHVKQAFGLSSVQIFGDTKQCVKKVAILPGSGKSCIEAAIEQSADLLITGDIGHHEGIDAYCRGLTILDAGHYGIEHIFIGDMCSYLESLWGKETEKKLEIQGAKIQHPFAVL